MECPVAATRFSTVRVALGSPFKRLASAALPASAALCRGKDSFYSSPSSVYSNVCIIGDFGPVVNRDCVKNPGRYDAYFVYFAVLAGRLASRRGRQGDGIP